MHGNHNKQPKSRAPMIKIDSKNQLMFDGFETEFEKWIEQDKKCSIANRIVSIHMPEVRPMVRGKAGKNVEFGAKPGVGITEDGLSHLDNLSWDAYNESHDMETHVNNYKKQHGHYPEKVLADKIYGTRISWRIYREGQIMDIIVN